MPITSHLVFVLVGIVGNGHLAVQNDIVVRLYVHGFHLFPEMILSRQGKVLVRVDQSEIIDFDFVRFFGIVHLVTMQIDLAIGVV